MYMYLRVLTPLLVAGGERGSGEGKDTPPTSKLVTKLFPQLKPPAVRHEEQVHTTGIYRQLLARLLLLLSTKNCS